MANTVESIMQELRQMEIGSFQPNTKRVVLLQRLNSMQAATRILPTEVLSLIFQHTCPYIYLDREGRVHNPRGWYSRRFLPLTLGHVCHDWRQVAWSTPNLWAALSLHVQLNTKLDNITAFLELYLTNVSNFPMSLDLDLPPSPKSPTSITNILFRPEYSRKIAFLQVANAPIGWKSSFSSFSRLRHLSLDGHSMEASEELSFTDVPSLVQVSLRDVKSRIILPWLSITTLHLDCVAIDTCAELFSRCLNLTAFHCLKALPPQNGWRGLATVPGPSTSNKLIYYHLESLTWSHVIDSHLLDLFGHIKLPAIRTLCWSQSRRLDLATPSLDSELLRHTKVLLYDLPSLISIKFQHLAIWPTSTIQELFGLVSSVQELTLKYCHQATTHNVLKVLGGTSTRLPLLRTLIISYPYEVSSEPGHGSYWVLRRQEEDLIVELLTKRLRRGVSSQFRLELQNASRGWETLPTYGLRSLIKQGYGLEFVVNGKTMEWL
ncbi:hypothetical protein P691DRAFT_545711 [Macrolepiota fuliginosa MF-IS2]|uniref:F-box domain-containing protein n=1 Tax=Macrolepiota fuliginosa MF-IS2 TaxID=1400762 RepID=A0A9P5XHF0_9AGAR|nr:hypothetical protein P691DRAFT_545711 [Macrolepiota fuliginosa MF-IS2]